jgi:outer membrane lipopolysaccharide assembly protein LptE/RlpB
MHTVTRVFQILAFGACLSSLSACGFSVVSPTAPMPFKTIKILGFKKPVSENSTEEDKDKKQVQISKKGKNQGIRDGFVGKLVVTLERRKGVEVVDELIDAQVVLELAGPRIQSYASGYDSAGRVREERVEAFLTVTLRNNRDQLISEPEELRISRYLAVSAGQPSIRAQDRKLTSEQLEAELLDRLLVKLTRFQSIQPQ